MHFSNVKCLLFLQTYIIFHGQVLEARQINEGFLDSPQAEQVTLYHVVLPTGHFDYCQYAYYVGETTTTATLLLT